MVLIIQMSFVLHFSNDAFPRALLVVFIIVAFLFLLTIPRIIIHQVVTKHSTATKRTKKIIDKYIRDKPQILTSFKLTRNHKEKQLPDKDYEFPFNYWINVSRVDSLNDHSIINVEFEVSFADEETKQSYERYVDQLKTDLSTTYDVGKNEIVTKTNFKFSMKDSLKREILYGYYFKRKFLHCISYLPLANYVTEMILQIFDRFSRINSFKIKKIISDNATEIIL